MANTEKATRMEDILKATQNKNTSVQDKSAPVQNKDAPKSAPREPAEKRERLHIPRGKPKSGKIWKEQKTKFSSIIKTRGIRLSLAKKQKLKEDLKRVKELSRAIKAEKEKQKEDKKQRRRDNLKRAEENSKKSEIVQVIKNPAKIKKMKKKQLRMIQKRDTLNM